MTTNAATSFRVFLLGVPQVHHNDALVHIKRRKAVALLAYLAVMKKPVSRNQLALLLSPDRESGPANAEVRRAWAALKEAGLGDLLTADREYLALRSEADLWIDADEFDQLLQQAADTTVLQRAADLYRGPFLAGFTLRGSDTFDEWQGMETERFERRFLAALNRLMQLYVEQQAYDEALETAERFLKHNYFDETMQQQAMRLYARTGQRTAALRLFEDYRRRLEAEMGVSPQPETVQLYKQLQSARSPETSGAGAASAGNMPPLPPLVLGREQAIADLKRLIGSGDNVASGPVVIQGWPGIGKTTVVSTLARDRDVHAAFPDGVLWVALGEAPDGMVELQTCANALGLPFMADYESPEAISAHLAAVCHDRRLLLIVDDVWDAPDFVPFNFAGPKSATLVTTRANGVAQQISARPDHIYKLPILSDEQSLNLLNVLAPDVVATNRPAVRELVHALEGLPLALQVAGRLLRAEYHMGWGIDSLLAELRTGTRLLSEQPPLDRVDMLRETTPTVAALLQRSTDRLDPEIRDRFALLGVFAPKPATFELDALQAVWDVSDPKPTARVLVDRGLMEPIGGGEFQIHALLVAHAKTLVLRPN